MEFDGMDGIPLVDPSVLKELREQLDEPASAGGFARDFVELWPARYEKLFEAVERTDRESLHDAVLSLKVASIMVGALRLGHLSERLEESISRSWPIQVQALSPIRICGRLTVEELARTGETGH